MKIWIFFSLFFFQLQAVFQTDEEACLKFDQEGMLELVISPKDFGLLNILSPEEALLVANSKKLRMDAASERLQETFFQHLSIFFIQDKQVFFDAEDSYINFSAEYFDALEYSQFIELLRWHLGAHATLSKKISRFKFYLDRGISQLFFWAYLEQLKFLDEMETRKKIFIKRTLAEDRSSLDLSRINFHFKVVRKALLQMLNLCFIWLQESTSVLNNFLQNFSLLDIKNSHFSNLETIPEVSDSLIFSCFLRFHRAMMERLLTSKRGGKTSILESMYWARRNFFKFLPGRARVIFEILRTSDEQILGIPSVSSLEDLFSD